MSRKVRVISPREVSYKIPLEAKKGETLTLGAHDVDWPGWIWGVANDGRKGWIPESYLEISGTTGKVTRDYTGRELSISIGDVLTAEYGEAGWSWCVDRGGNTGWVPDKHLEPSS